MNLHASAALVGLVFLASVGVPAAHAQRKILAQNVLFDTLRVQAIKDQIEPKLSTSLIVVDPKTNTATFDVINRGDSTLTVALKLEFYRVRTDTAGNVLHTGGSLMPNDVPSLVDWVRGLPAQVTLAPHKTQSITLTLTVPDTAAAPEYWARVVAATPAVQRQVLVVRQLILAPETPGGAPTLVQQPATGNIPFPNTTVARIAYRRGTPSTGVTLSDARATMLPNGYVRTCVDLKRTGTATLLGTVHMSVRTPTGRDTLTTEFPLEAQSDMHPCFNVLMLGMPAGSYTISLVVDPVRPDIMGTTHLTFTPAKITASVDLTPPIASAPSSSLGTATVTSAPTKGVPLIELIPERGALATQLKREADLAAKEGKRVLVEVGAAWCAPCHLFLNSLSDSIMVDALKNARVVRVDFDRWGDAFVNGPYAIPAALPAFFMVNPDGSQGAHFDTNRWLPLAKQYGVLDARAMGPPLKAFLAETSQAGVEL